MGSLGMAEQALVEKALNAGQQVMAHQSLLLDENWRLIEQNLEKQVRTSTVSRKVGMAKVMSHEDIVHAGVSQTQETARSPTEMVKKGLRGSQGTKKSRTGKASTRAITRTGIQESLKWTELDMR
ncbi:uncharacterized protein AB675_7375 [Cyphellophora attinorum]|uniref:Uncharacterized protein n=1 Tax=Cyphellophora attinorum TaxID=1664694 RepID=A0A0N1HJ43_9EURO|nr:uncharacterized protein AB675_7375 [Phialophora attinorum]KPI36343.1 hypothetical protein AB675_7375 [Phialophora attinorum]